MFGAIIGDIVGSRYEGSGMRSKRFAMFAPECHFTDDTVMTVAVARALLECDWHEEEVYKEILVRQMRWLGRAYHLAQRVHHAAALKQSFELVNGASNAEAEAGAFGRQDSPHT